jgi:hypothetical protein
VNNPAERSAGRTRWRDNLPHEAPLWRKWNPPPGRITTNFVVLPLSAVPFHLKYTPQSLLQGFVSHALLVGIPIDLCVRRFSFYRAPLSSGGAR